MVTKSVTQDIRAIESLHTEGWSIHLNDEIWEGWTVAEITCYTENGEMAEVPWFAVWVTNGEYQTISERIPGKQVHVRYEKP